MGDMYWVRIVTEMVEYFFLDFEWMYWLFNNIFFLYTIFLCRPFLNSLGFEKVLLIITAKPKSGCHFEGLYFGYLASLLIHEEKLSNNSNNLLATVVLKKILYKPTHFHSTFVLCSIFFLVFN